MSPKAMEEMRIRPVERVQAGEGLEIVIKTLGFFRTCIYSWLAKCRSGGWQAMRRGYRSGISKNLPVLRWDGYIEQSKTKIQGNLNLR